MPREKSRYRDRRSSSYSSDSSYDRKKSKSKHKRRSRSRDRSESISQRRKRSTSRSRHKRRSYSRSPSRDRYEKRRRSTSRTRSRRERSYSRSSSRSRKYKTSKKSKRRSRSSSSRSESFDIGNRCDSSSSDELGSILSSLLHFNLKNEKKPLLSKRPLPPRVNLDDTDIKIEKAIKAAEAAGLTLTKIPTYEYKEVEIKEDMPTIHDRNLLAELNSDLFIQKPFVSSSKKKESRNIVIDLNSQTVTVPEAEIKQKEVSIINFNEIPSEEELKEMWIKKLTQFRKRMLKGEI